MRYSLPLMLTVMLALAGCEKNGENAEDAAANAALAKSTAVSHGEIAAPPGFNEAINSGKPVMVDFYADW